MADDRDDHRREVIFADVVARFGTKKILSTADHIHRTSSIRIRHSEALDLAIAELAAKKEDERVAKVNDNGVTTPAFAAVVQAEYRWKEGVNEHNTGRTDLPKNRGDQAVMSIPDGPFIQTPEGRLVRVHELLHARYTPAIEALSRKLKDVSAMAIQVGEDVRLHAIGREIGVLGDDVYVSDAAYKAAAAPPKDAITPPIIREVETAKMFMAGYGLPTETGWSSKDLTAFQEVTEMTFSRRSRRVLKAWASMAEKALKLPTEEAQFQALAGTSHKAIEKLVKVPPQGGGKGKQDQKPKAGGEGKENKDGGAGGQDGDHPATPSTYQKEVDKAAADYRSAANSGNHAAQRDAEARYHRANQQARACGQALQQLDSKSLAGWEPAFLKQSDIRQLEKKANAEAEDNRWTPSLIPHTSKYLPWTGPKPDEALAKNYTLDPLDRGWHVMRKQLGPIQRNFKAIVRRKGIASPEGPIPKFFGRWFSDKQLFERKGRRLGGTLLIDTSGSMGWSHAQTMALIEATPAMTIAVYSSIGGRSDEEQNRIKDWQRRNPNGSADGIVKFFREQDIAGGILTIIAQHGKLVSADYVIHGPVADDKCAGHGGGNEVDGPALAWLARQAQPRVWFSDGQVTGTGEVSSEQLWNDSRRLQRLGNIVRTTNAGAVKKIFSNENGWQTMDEVYPPGCKESGE